MDFLLAWSVGRVSSISLNIPHSSLRSLNDFLRYVVARVWVWDLNEGFW